MIVQRRLITVVSIRNIDFLVFEPFCNQSLLFCVIEMPCFVKNPVLFHNGKRFPLHRLTQPSVHFPRRIREQPKNRAEIGLAGFQQLHPILFRFG